MDINEFEIHEDYFGFDSYKRSPKSNLDFLNFTKVEETEEYKRLLRYHRDMVDNIKESGLPQSEIDKQLSEEEKRFGREVLKLRGERTVEGASKFATAFGSIFNKATSALGISQSPNNQQAPINISYNERSGNGGRNRRRVYWIVGGLTLVAIVGYVIYKKTK